MPSVNEFVVADGCVSMQGHAVQIKLESLDVDTCATGYARIDLVCCRFTHNTSSLIDNAELVVIKGDEVADSNTPQPPAYSEGIIDEGATQVDFPMYQELINLIMTRRRYLEDGGYFDTRHKETTSADSTK